MRIGYLECFAGISGDMLLGALLDAGVSPDLLHTTAAALNIGAQLKIHSVDRSGIRSTKVDVLVNGQPAETVHAHDHVHDHDHSHSHDHEHHGDHSHTNDHGGHSHSHSHSHSESSQHSHAHEHQHSHTHGRSWAQIRELLHHVSIPDDVRALSLKTFELLAHAEAKIHGIPVDEVHFHEVGAVDTITDIVCSAAGICSLRIDRWHASPVNVGGGFVECAHGTFPVPAPATADLLKGLPTYSAGPKKELVTPTGAALLRALDCTFGDAPAFAAQTIGYGAGGRNPERFPNVLRLSIGEGTESPETSSTAHAATDTVIVLECAVDDATPQVIAHAMELALENGALDAMAAPVAMKKGRLGTLLTVLVRPENAEAIEALLFRETTTLGIRRRREERVILDRAFVTVETPYGRIRIKIGSLSGQPQNLMPEFEDCRRAAREHNVPLKRVVEAALASYSEALTASSKK